MQAVILAGGKGTRLRPFTTNFPKPLVPIDNTPILEIVLKQLKYHGFNKIILAVNHLSELIKSYFGSGEKLGVKITYSCEQKELGTAGPLSIIPNLDDNFLVMNGDLLTTLNYSTLFTYHLEKQNDITIAAYKKDIKIDLGVLELKEEKFYDYIEKPTYSFNVSMGIYIMKKSVIKYIPVNQKMDLPDLILKLHSANKKIFCYRGNYYWLDIGRVEDYESAVEIFKEKKGDFLPHE